MADYMLVTHAIQIELNITPTAQAPTWAVFGNGIDNLTEALNETIQQYFFMSNKGFASNYVTGQAPAYTCTGRKIVGDPAQEWIFNPSRKFGLMAERDTQILVSVPAANNLINQFTANVTIANVTDLGGATTDGSALGIAASDDVFDPLTIIGGTIEMKDGRLRQSFDCRYPTSTTAEHLTEMMTQVCGAAATLEDVSSRVPFYIAADSPAIQTLITTYNDVTGENKKPFTMGGGTYARHFPYAVSFGPEHTDIELPEFAGPMHGANEGTPFEKLIEALKIYILALLRLQEIEL